MSGIVGIYYYKKQSVESSKLQKMLDILAHRGFDGVNVWHQNNVGLGHRMLCTTPESLIETLPTTNKAGDLTITADARIDNRDELIDILNLQTPPETITDSQLILTAYEKWGEACPQKLLGDFAFAIWDASNQRLFCARDHFGVKPFYYYQSDRSTIFASEIKAIVGLQEVPLKINEVRIADYLTSTLEDVAITSYQNVWRLPPAHTLTIDSNNQLKLNRYWSLQPGKEIKYQSDSEYAEKFREIFTEAVRCRLRSAFPIGSHLSGGLDSSSVTCVARDLLKQESIKLHSFSNIFDTVPECNERSYIETTLAQGGLIPHFIHPDKTGPISEWQDFFKYADESLIGNAYLIWGLNRASKEAGVRVVLNGFDGDTTVSHGALRLTELAKAQQWSSFIEEGTAVAKSFQQPPHSVLLHYGVESTLIEFAKKGRWLAFFKAVNRVAPHVRLSPRQLIVKYGLKALVPNSGKQIWRKLRRLRRGKPINPQTFPLVNSNFAERIKLKQRIAQFDRSNNPPLTVREHHWQELSSGLMTIPLEGMDIFAAAFGIEYRHPFMDKRLIEYCLALPADQKLSQGWSRIVLRKAMEGILHPEIQWRGDKSNLSRSFEEGLFKFDKELLKETILNKSKDAADYLDTEQLCNIYNTLIAKNKLRSNTIEEIWSAISLCLWLEKLQK